MRRGDIVTAVLAGDYGKPRPCLIVQSDLMNPTHASFLVCPFTTHAEASPAFRLEVAPTPENGLAQRSWLMVDKVGPVRRDKIGGWIGRLDDTTVSAVNDALMIVLGLP